MFHWLILIIRVREVERLPAFCYLTNIVYLCCTMYYTVAVYNSLSHREETIPLYHKLLSASQVFRMDKVCYEEKTTNSVQLTCLLQWLLHSIALTMGILVSLTYFLLIHDPSKDTLGLTNVSRHILNSVFILIEFFLNALAVKFVHIIYCVLLAICYAVYTLIFWYAVPPPENYIYRIINWDKPVRTGVLILVLMCAAVVLNLLLVLASKLKLRFSFPAHEPSSQSFLV